MRIAFIAVFLCVLAACAGQQVDHGPFSDRRISGPADYTVDWDLPETDYFWLPKENEQDLMPASKDCGAPIEGFIYHHLPRPPQYSYTGFRFAASVSQTARACLLSRLKAVPALTIYEKKK